jgi:hypothetical protein
VLFQLSAPAAHDVNFDQAHAPPRRPSANDWPVCQRPSRKLTSGTSLQRCKADGGRAERPAWLSLCRPYPRAARSLQASRRTGQPSHQAAATRSHSSASAVDARAVLSTSSVEPLRATPWPWLPAAFIRTAPPPISRRRNRSALTLLRCLHPHATMSACSRSSQLSSPARDRVLISLRTSLKWTSRATRTHAEADCAPSPSRADGPPLMPDPPPARLSTPTSRSTRTNPETKQDAGARPYPQRKHA